MHFAVLRGEGDLLIDARTLDLNLVEEVAAVLEGDLVFASP